MNIPLNIDIQQILLHLFNFVILAGGLYLLLYKPVKKFMEQREDYYKGLDKEAKAKLEQAETLEADYQKKLDKADDEILAMKSNTAAELEKIRIQKIEEAEKQADKIVSDAKKNAEIEKMKILDGTQKEIAEMVTTATEKLLLHATPSEAFDKFLTAAERSDENE